MSGGTLTIEPGVTVKFNGPNRQLIVNSSGAISADGVLFTSLADDSTGGDDGGDGPSSGQAGQWQAITIRPSNTLSTFRNVEIRYGANQCCSAHSVGALQIYGGSASVLVEDAWIHDNLRSGIVVGPNSSVSVARSVIERNQNGISVVNGQALVSERSLLQENSQDGYYLSLTYPGTIAQSALLDSDTSRNGRYGVYITPATTLPLSLWPTGTRSNIDENTGGQLWTTQKRRDASWEGNYWGPGVTWKPNQPVCLTTGEQSYGRLLYSGPNGSPINWASYGAGTPTTICDYNYIEVLPGDYSPYRLDGTAPPVPVEQTDGLCGDDEHAEPTTACASDPVNTATGNFVRVERDLALRGVGIPFRFTRTYNSRLAGQVGTLGPGWRHSYSDKLTFANGSGDATLHTARGAKLAFVKNPKTGAFTANPGISSTLAPVSGGYELARRDGVIYRFDPNGRLTSIKNAGGWGLSFSYEEGGHLTSVSDSLSHQITLTYNGSGRLTSVALPDGRSVSYAYSSGRLTTVTDVRGKVWSYAYDLDGRLESETTPRQHPVFFNFYDSGNGRLVEQSDALGNVTRVDWNPSTQTATVTDPDGNVWKDVYKDNVLTKRIDPLGNTTEIEFNHRLHRAKITDPRGSVWKMTYDGRGNLLKRVAPAPFNYTETWTYTLENKIASYTNRRGFTTSFEYDGNGRLLRIVRPGNSVTVYGRDPNTGLVTSVTDADGFVTRFERDPTRPYQVTAVVRPRADANANPSEYRTTFTYNAYGQVASIVEARGNVPGADPDLYRTSFTYDASGRMLTRTDAHGNTNSFSYDANGNLTEFMNAKGRTWTYAYNEANELVRATEPPTMPYEERTTTYDYTKRGQLKYMRTPGGAETFLTYDELGRPWKLTDARGFTITLSYDISAGTVTATDAIGLRFERRHDRLGRLVSYKDGRGKATTFSYDASSNLETLTDADGNSWSFDYNNRDLLEHAHDPRGFGTHHTYDKRGNRTSLTSPLGAKETASYNEESQLEWTVDPRGNAPGADPELYKTRFAYDAAGNLARVTDPLGNVVEHAYDRIGRPSASTDARGNTTSWEYDELGQRSAVVAPGNHRTSYEYDEVGDLSERRDPNNVVTSYDWDLDHRLLSSVFPASGWGYVYSHDAVGNLVSRENTEPSHGYSHYAYDARNRLTEITHAVGMGLEPTPDVSFSYDDADRPAAMTDGYGTETYTWTDAGRPASVTRGTDTISYLYTDALLTRRTYPGGAQTNYAYDEDGRLETVSANGATSTYAYDAASRLTSTSFPNGVLESRAYDRAGRLSEIASELGSTTHSRYTVERDASGNPTKVTTPTGVETYAYDSQGRLTEVCYQLSCPNASDPFIRWTYDGVGNRLSESRPEGTTIYSYTDGRLSFISGYHAPGYGYVTWHADRIYTLGGERFFRYDQEGRLVSVRAGNQWGEEAEELGRYGYDGVGKRLRATDSVSGETRKFLWDTNASLPQLALERDGQDALLRRYTLGLAPLALSAGSGSTSYYQRDWIGSITGVTDAAGTLEHTYAYEPFGETRTQTSAPGATENQLGFTGEYREPTSGFYHLRARDYDPELGAFHFHDPLAPDAFAPYISPYAYANQAPTRFTDPSGLMSLDDLTGAIADRLESGGQVLLGSSDALLATWYAFSESAAHPSSTLEEMQEQGLNGLVNGFVDTLTDCFEAYEGGDDRTLGRTCTKAGAMVTPYGGMLGRFSRFRHGDDVIDDIRAFDEMAALAALLSDAAKAAPRAWQRGDDIWAPTRAGNDPAWSTVRERYWKNVAEDPRAVAQWDAGNLARMRSGRAPQRFNPDKGGMESMELSHEPIPRRHGGRALVPRWPQDHAAVDPYRRPGY